MVHCVNLPTLPIYCNRFILGSPKIDCVDIDFLFCSCCQLQDLRGNIRVFCRCRYDSRTKCCLQFPSDTEILPPHTKKPFQFNRVFDVQSTQEQVR